MAKIRNVFIRVDNEDVKKSFNVDILYSNKEKRFEISLPDELKEVAIGFTYQENHEQGIKYVPDYRQGNDRLSGRYYVIGDTEAQVEQRATEVFKFLNNQQVQRRNVIVIDFQEYDNRHYRESYNQEHPKTGLQFGLLYCTETKSGETGKPNYTITETYNGGLNNDGFSKVRQREFASSAIVIDDTEANRMFLENTYTLLSRLVSQLSEYCKTPEAMLQLIASNQKLIG